MGSDYQDNKYQTRHWKYGGMRKGYKFLLCPKCGKHGVSSKVMLYGGKATARKSCKYCGWFEGSLH